MSEVIAVKMMGITSVVRERFVGVVREAVVRERTAGIVREGVVRERGYPRTSGPRYPRPF
jgi:hypothetical protein